MDIESKTPEKTAKLELSVPSFVIRIYHSLNCADSSKFGVAFNRFIKVLCIHQSGFSIQYLSMVLSAELKGGAMLAEQLSHLMIALVLFKSIYKPVFKIVKRPQGVIMMKYIESICEILKELINTYFI